MKSKQVKREEAKVRKEKYEALTPEEKVKKLDDKLGVGVGAAKERKRLEEVK